jgi:hypothetical protein
MYIYVFSVPLYMVYENKDDWLIDSDQDEWYIDLSQWIIMLHVCLWLYYYWILKKYFYIIL